MNERLWELLAKHWAGRITAEEKAEMEQLLLDHPNHWLKAGLIQQISWHPEEMLSVRQLDRISDRILSRRMAGAGKAAKAPLQLPYWKLAVMTVAVLMAITLGVLAYRQYHGTKALSWQQLTTAKAMKTMVRLSDGSEVWLNVASTLRYPGSFASKTREVYLSGEASFKIAGDTAVPFIIHTPDFDLLTGGAACDVWTYPEESSAKVSVRAGSLALTAGGPDAVPQLTLGPGQKAVVVRRPAAPDSAGRPPRLLQGDVRVEAADTSGDSPALETAWKDNVFAFHDESLGVLARRIARWYNVQVRVTGSAGEDQRFTGRLEDPSLRELLDTLARTHAFTFEIRGQQVVIR